MSNVPFKKCVESGNASAKESGNKTKQAENMKNEVEVPAAEELPKAITVFFM